MSAIVARNTPPTPLPQESATKEDKHVSFHPLAVYITTAPEGEPEKTMVDHAREELSQRKRRVRVRTYRCDCPAPVTSCSGTDEPGSRAAGTRLRSEMRRPRRGIRW